jgi:hypothetical protein
MALLLSELLTLSNHTSMSIQIKPSPTKKKILTLESLHQYELTENTL